MEGLPETSFKLSPGIFLCVLHLAASYGWQAHREGLLVCDLFTLSKTISFRQIITSMLTTISTTIKL